MAVPAALVTAIWPLAMFTREVAPGLSPIRHSLVTNQKCPDAACVTLPFRKTADKLVVSMSRERTYPAAFVNKTVSEAPGTIFGDQFAVVEKEPPAELVQ